MLLDTGFLKVFIIPMELLKLLVLIKANMFFDRSFDPSELSEILLAVTGRYISETTLFHLYGFIPSKLPPSIYTKDALAAYCGYESYQAYLADIGIEDS
jgi:hypothetical protein